MGVTRIYRIRKESRMAQTEWFIDKGREATMLSNP